LIIKIEKITKKEENMLYLTSTGLDYDTYKFHVKMYEKDDKIITQFVIE